VCASTPQLSKKKIPGMSKKLTVKFSYVQLCPTSCADVDLDLDIRAIAVKRAQFTGRCLYLADNLTSQYFTVFDVHIKCYIFLELFNKGFHGGFPD
jgi:hypothetical protein